MFSRSGRSHRRAGEPRVQNDRAGNPAGAGNTGCKESCPDYHRWDTGTAWVSGSIETVCRRNFYSSGQQPFARIVRQSCLLPHRSVFFHPDLVNASDAVVGKVGYSTIAEVYAAGVPFGHAARSPYPESPGLVDFISRQMTGIALSEADFASGRWLAILPKLLELPRQPREASNGSEQIAAYICKVLENRNITREHHPGKPGDAADIEVKILKIVLTNRIGIDMPGLETLNRIARIHGDSVIVAPETAQSGVGHRVTTRTPLPVKLLDKNRYSVGGTPVDCVRLALKGFCTGCRLAHRRYQSRGQPRVRYLPVRHDRGGTRGRHIGLPVNGGFTVHRSRLPD